VVPAYRITVLKGGADSLHNSI